MYDNHLTVQFYRLRRYELFEFRGSRCIVTYAKTPRRRVYSPTEVSATFCTTKLLVNFKLRDSRNIRKHVRQRRNEFGISIAMHA